MPQSGSPLLQYSKVVERQAAAQEAKPAPVVKVAPIHAPSGGAPTRRILLAGVRSLTDLDPKDILLGAARQIRQDPSIAPETAAVALEAVDGRELSPNATVNRALIRVADALEAISKWDDSVHCRLSLREGWTQLKLAVSIAENAVFNAENPHVVPVRRTRQKRTETRRFVRQLDAIDRAGLLENHLSLDLTHPGFAEIVKATSNAVEQDRCANEIGYVYEMVCEISPLAVAFSGAGATASKDDRVAVRRTYRAFKDALRDWDRDGIASDAFAETCQNLLDAVEAVGVDVSVTKAPAPRQTAGMNSLN